MKETQLFKDTFANRPHTWSEQIEKLKQEGGFSGRRSTGPFPHFFGRYMDTAGPAIAEAIRITGAPLAISEEQWPDQPGVIFVYRIGECADGWADEDRFEEILDHLLGTHQFRRCSVRCAKFDMPEYVPGPVEEYTPELNPRFWAALKAQWAQEKSPQC